MVFQPMPPSDEGGGTAAAVTEGEKSDYPSVSLSADSSPDKGSQGTVSYRSHPRFNRLLPAQPDIF